MTESSESTDKEFNVSGSDLLKKLKEIVHQGNIRHILIKNESGKTLIELPLSMGILGVAIIPVYAAVGAIAALAVKCTIEVRTAKDPD